MPLGVAGREAIKSRKPKPFQPRTAVDLLFPEEEKKRRKSTPAQRIAATTEPAIVDRPQVREARVARELAPRRPPVADLQQHGFHGDINDANDRLWSIHRAHEKIYGFRPSPALVFDLFRAPLVNEAFEHLLSSPRGARAGARRGRVEKFAQESPFPVPLAFDKVFGHPIREAFKEVPPLASTKSSLDKKYPTTAGVVEAGFLPIANLGDLMEGLADLRDLAGEGSIQVRSNGMTLEEFEEIANKLDVQSGYVEGSYLREPRVAGTGEKQRLGPGGRLWAAVTKVREAQENLNQAMGTDLPVNGIIDEDWAEAIQTWQKSDNYRLRVVQYQAEEAGYKGRVGEYVGAWKNKQKAIKELGGWGQHLAAHLPMQIFDDGLSWDDLLKSTAKYITSDGALINPLNPHFGVTASLHTLTRSAGLGLSLTGGTIDQVRVDLAAGHAFVHAVAPESLNGRGESIDEATERMKKVLHANPSWIRVLFPMWRTDPQGWAKRLDQAANLVGDMIILRKPFFLGRSIPVPTYRNISKSAHHNTVANYAFVELERNGTGGLGRAAEMLDGDLGAERFLRYAVDRVSSGEMPFPTFRNHLRDLFVRGQTDIVTKKGVPGVIRGSVHNSLIGEYPTKGRALLKAKDFLRHADTVDEALRDARLVGTTRAADFFSFMRARFLHAAPGQVAYFDPKAPQMLHSFLIRTFGEAKLARDFQSRFVALRAADDVPGLVKLEDEVRALYRQRYPRGQAADAPEIFSPLIQTEAPVVFGFPGGRAKELEGFFDYAEASVKAMNRGLNSLAHINAKLILSGAPTTPYLGGGLSLFWKHAIGGDLARRFVGGGIEGPIERRTNRKTWAEIEGLFKTDLQLHRDFLTSLERVTMGETRWLVGPGGKRFPESFRTGEIFNDSRRLKAAGGYLRRLLTAPAMRAYQGGPASIREFIRKDTTTQKLFRSAQKEDPSLTETDFAELLWRKYYDFEQAGYRAGLDNPLEETLAVIGRSGGADKRLGKFIKDNKLDFDVTKGLVEKVGGVGGTFDHLTGRLIQKVMTFNKWHRGQMYKTLVPRYYRKLVKSGMEPENAMRVSLSVSEKQTVYHMLDFANRLQIENDLRWISYFATKHRLYWKWVVGTFFRHPRYAAAIHDLQDVLGSDNAIDLPTIKLPWYGEVNLEIPVARLAWVPGREYDEHSALSSAVFGGAKSIIAEGSLTGFQTGLQSTWGNVATRNDTAIRMGIAVARISSGTHPATFDFAVSGLDERSRDFMYFRFNEFQNDFFQEHGYFPSEAQTVKYVLPRALAGEYWRANMPLPVLEEKSDRPEQALLREFLLISNPGKRRKFLDKHPDLRGWFGIWDNPKEYAHIQSMWSRYNAASDMRDAKLATIWNRAKASGGYTPAMYAERRLADKEFHEQLNLLLIEDAEETGGLIVGKSVKKPGLWGKQISPDPYATLTMFSKLFPKVPKKQVVAATGADIVPELKLELARLNDPKFAATYGDPDQVKARKREIYERLEIFRRAPTQPLRKWEAKYQDIQNDYWSEYKNWYKRIDASTRSERPALRAEFRAWRDEHTQDVTVDGIKAPGPALWAWAVLAGPERRRRLNILSAAHWGHLTDYEKSLLGKKVDEGISESWYWLEDYLRSDRKAAGLQGTNLPKGWEQGRAQQIDRRLNKPGFYKDWLFAQRPKWERLQILRPVTESRFKEDWHNLLTNASKWSSAGGSENTKKAYWKKNVDEYWVPYFNKPEHRGFRRELQTFVDDDETYLDFIYSLINRGRAEE